MDKNEKIIQLQAVPLKGDNYVLYALTNNGNIYWWVEKEWVKFYKPSSDQE